MSKTLWYAVQNVRTKRHHVVRHEKGATEDDLEFLTTRNGWPREFANGEAAHAAAEQANANRWREVLAEQQAG